MEVKILTPVRAKKDKVLEIIVEEDKVTEIDPVKENQQAVITLHASYSVNALLRNRKPI
jgi:hypothetical protein